MTMNYWLSRALGGTDEMQRTQLPPGTLGPARTEDPMMLQPGANWTPIQMGTLSDRPVIPEGGSTPGPYRIIDPVIGDVIRRMTNPHELPASSMDNYAGPENNYGQAPGDTLNLGVGHAYGGSPWGGGVQSSSSNVTGGAHAGTGTEQYAVPGMSAGYLAGQDTPNSAAFRPAANMENIRTQVIADENIMSNLISQLVNALRDSTPAQNFNNANQQFQQGGEQFDQMLGRIRPPRVGEGGMDATAEGVVSPVDPTAQNPFPNAGSQVEQAQGQAFGAEGTGRISPPNTGGGGLNTSSSPDIRTYEEITKTGYQNDAERAALLAAQQRMGVKLGPDAAKALSDWRMSVGEPAQIGPAAGGQTQAPQSGSLGGAINDLSRLQASGANTGQGVSVPIFRGGTKPSGTASIPSEIVQAMQQVFPQQEWNTALRIIAAESEGQNVRSKPNTNGTVDNGYFQINDIHMGMNVRLPDGSTVRLDKNNVMNPVVNAAAAKQLWQNSQGWTPWSTKNNVFAGMSGEGR